MGVTGAAIGVGLSEMAGTFFLLFFGFKKRILIPGWINHGLIRQVFQVGLPVFADRILQQAGQMIFVKAIMIYGTVTYAAQQVGLVIEAFAFLPALGISMATTTLVGQRLGATQPQHASIVNWEANRLALWVMTGMGLLFFFAPDPLLRIFTGDPVVIQQGIYFLKIVAFLQIPLAISMVLSGSLKGAGDTSFLFWTTVIGGWGIRIPFAWLFVLVLDWEVTAVWSLLVVDWVVRMSLLIYRYRSLKWQKKSLIRSLPENQGLILAPVRNE